MSIVEKVNLGATIISVIVTGISIWFSIRASKSAKSAEKIKDDVLEKIHVLDFKEIVDLYRSKMLEFRSKTRDSDWFKGREVSPIIDPFETALTKLNSIYPMIKSCNLQEKVNELLPLVRCFHTLKRTKITSAIQLMEDIDRELQKCLHEKVGSIN